MTPDAARARALAEALLGEVGLTSDVLAALEQSFERVRADERRAIVAWLRNRIGREAPIYADEIERGEHVS